MASKDFRQTAKTVSKNFQKYTQAMEEDIQVLIVSLLNVIETKIAALRKLLRLKLCIKRVKSIAGLEYISNLDDASLSPTYTLNERKEKDSDSLEDLSSIVYEVDKKSLPKEEKSFVDDNTHKRLRYLEDMTAIQSMCSTLKNRSSKVDSTHKDELNANVRCALDKYIYLLLDSEKRKGKSKEVQQKKAVNTENIGDFEAQISTAELEPAGSQSIVYLDKTEYESILDILNTVLKSYKIQEEIATKNKVIEKTQTEPYINTNVNQSCERKIVSDSICQQKDCIGGEKKARNRKNCFM